METIFTNVYENQMWGDNLNADYKGSSGHGSTVEYNLTTYVPFIKKFIRDNNIKYVADLGCGDFKCGPLIYDELNVVYTGYDAYKKIIDYNSKMYSLPKYFFIHLDFCNYKERIVRGEMCILKDVLQHWSLQDIYVFLDYLVVNKIFKYILIINCCQQYQDNTDITNGDWRPLSHKFLPLKKYNPIQLYTYHTKEIILIST